MTDEELVKLAREWSENDLPKPPFYSTGLLILAMADRIEELERKNAEMNKLYGEVKEGLEAKLAKAMELLRFISQMHGYTSRQLSDLARTKLAELEGGE